MFNRRCLDIIIMKSKDYYLKKVLRGNYRRNSNQKTRSAYFLKYYSYLINRFKRKGIPQIANDGPIWMFWWQGEEAMPPIVQKCYMLAKKNAPVDHTIVLLTEKNYREYVDIPSYIIEKVRNKQITLTHFSDILRVSLLAEYGGLWMDATMFTTGPIPLEFFKKDFFSIRTPDDGQWVSRCLWTGFFMGGVKGHPLFQFMRDLFFDYWKEHTELLDYFLIDVGIVMAYDNIPLIRQSVDRGVWNTDQLFFLQKNISKPFNQEQFDHVLAQWSFFKVTYRDYFGKLVPYNEKGEETFYGYLLKFE